MVPSDDDPLDDGVQAHETFAYWVEKLAAVPTESAPVLHPVIELGGFLDSSGYFHFALVPLGGERWWELN